MNGNVPELVVHLKDEENLSYREIGKRIHKSRDAVRSMYRRQKGTHHHSHGGSRPNTGGISISGHDNEKEVESVSPRIKTLEDLLAACNIDQTIWKVDRYVINKWEIGRKAETKELRWTDGVIDGHEQDTGKIEVEPLFQVKAWLVKRVPEPIEFHIQPVSLSIPDKKIDSSRNKDTSCTLIIPDVHFGFRRNIQTGALNPFHDRLALDVALQVAQIIRPNKIVYLGDILDLAEWTDKFVKAPEFYFATQPAIIEAVWWMGQFAKTEPDESYLLEGNHDRRVESCIAQHLLSAYQLHPANESSLFPSLSIPRLLCLESLKVKWIGNYPDSQVWILPDVMCIHGNVANSDLGETAKTISHKSEVSVVFGHIHRIEQVSRTVYGQNGPRIITAMSPGCLCRIDGTVPGHNRSQNWQQGIGLVYSNKDGNNSIASMQIHNGAAIFNGISLKARDRLPEIRKDTNWEFATESS